MTHILKLLPLNLEEIFTPSGISKYQMKSERVLSHFGGKNNFSSVCMCALHSNQDLPRAKKQGLQYRSTNIYIKTAPNKKSEPSRTWETELWQSNKINVLWNCHIFCVRCFLLPIEALDIFNLGSLFFLSEGPAFAFVQVITSIDHLNIISADKWRHKYRKNFWFKGWKTFESSLSALQKNNNK